MKKVKPGDTVMINGVVYRFGESSSCAMNDWLEFLEEGVSDEGITIHLYTENRKEGEFFSPSKILEALGRENWNKTPHGL